METRRQTKAAVVEEVRAARAARRERSAQLKEMTPQKRREARAADRAQAKATARERKAEVKAMAGDERRLAKRHDRMYRKVWNRPRRLVVWIAVVLVLALLVAVATPYVRDISRVMSISVDSNTPEGEAARAKGALIAEEIADEGIVLLTNDDDLLPLGDRSVSVFGFASFNIRHGGGGSGGADQSRSVGLYAGLERAGVEYNRELRSFMESQGASEDAATGSGLVQILGNLISGSDPDEPDIDYLTDDALAQAREYSDVALVVMGNDGVEMSDFTPEQLRITDNQRDLLDRVTGAFDDVVLVVNSGNAMELGFIDDYPQIRSALWIGTPGPYGTVSLGKILTGEVNPSGRLTDTYPYDVASHPAAQNFGDYRYENFNRGLIEYEEGIYVGYRYFETRYAADEAAYAEAVQFPFGHGLSYTTFAHSSDVTVSGGAVIEEDIRVTVEVTNTGDVAGKDVVQVYFSAPWTPGGIEKSAVELAGYAKTGLLAPGESETVVVEFPATDMASWDLERGAWVLEEGSYKIGLGTNVHETQSLLDYYVGADVVLNRDVDTGAELANRFDYADGGLTYLSRADWEGTWPSSADIQLTASQELLDAMTAAPASSDAPEVTFGAEYGIELAELKGLDYDDALWDSFLDQFTLEEMMELFSRGAYQTQAVERLGVPAAILLDGPAGINFFFGELAAASYPTQVVVASTWNDDLARRMGEVIGEEANAYGVHGWYAPGMNLHRTAQGGRNFEYFSEDPLLSGRMGAAMVDGAQSRDVLVFMKHFLLNEQEVNARSGVNVFANEQAIRELYLKPFEITVKEADATGAMSSFIHIGHKWSGGNVELLQDVLRGEWGFDGVVTTDAVLGGFMDNRLAVRNGNDLMLDVLSPSSNLRQLRADHRADPTTVEAALRARVHAICFSLLRTTLFG